MDLLCGVYKSELRLLAFLSLYIGKHKASLIGDFEEILCGLHVLQICQYTTTIFGAQEYIGM
ncbi:hypothetical protein C0J52_01725 [Blattella germanica]|nr:hypothetical protein C0J52_01725 [Blattella germanica]